MPSAELDCATMPDKPPVVPPETPELALLRLLADGASVTQLGRVGADPEALALAVRAATRVEDQRGRERALRALVDTARDLAATTDPSGVLDAIVRRARGLLGSDVSYLTLYDPEHGDTYMRATDGVVAASFRTVRLPLGAGLGGLVASTREAWWTSDYHRDTRFAHLPSIDSPVADEGLVGICGTPLLVEDEFVGVLFASYRRRHLFSPEEVALLGSLASLAALSILQARSRQANEAALAELSLAHEAEHRHAQDVERSAAAHDRFTQLVASGGGVDDLTRAVTEVLGGWTVLLDVDGTRRSGFGPVPGQAVEVGAADPLADGELVRQAREAAYGVHDGETYGVGVRARRELIAMLVCGAAGSVEANLPIVERAAAVTAVLLVFERETAAARQRALADQLSDLIAGGLSAVDAGRLLTREGLNPHRPFCLVAMRGRRLPTSGLLLAAGAVVGDEGLVGEHHKRLVALVAGDDPGVAAATLVRRLAATDEVTAAGVGPLPDAAAIPEAFVEAARTVDAMLALGRRGEGAATGDLGFAGLIVGSTPDVAGYVDRVLGPVLTYDRERGTSLVSTLEAYFAADRALRRTGEVLHVHANTVVQRLDRVATLLGERWQEPESALEIQLALRLRRLLDPARRFR